MRFGELIEGIMGGCGAEGGARRVAGDPEIVRVCEDSRQVRAGDLFVARAGSKTSGANFAVDAIAKGAVAVVSQELLELPGHVAFAQVGNANRAAALLADALAGNPTRGMKLIGVTGTKGKTTVAYLMRSVLKAAGFKVGMIGTVEIDDGVRVTPAEMTTPSAVELAELFARMKSNGVTHCVMEVSSHALHQQRTAALDFAVAIFTNLTGDHLDYHKTMEEYAAAKALLFEGLSEEAVAVVNAKDAWCERMVRGCRAKVVRYAVTEDEKQESSGNWLGYVSMLSPGLMRVEISGPGGLKFPFINGGLIGRHNAANVLAACAAATALGVKMPKLFYSLKKLMPPPGRLQRVGVATNEPHGLMWELTFGSKAVRRPQEFSVFVDYAHTHDALENVLKALRTTMEADQSRDRKGATDLVAGARGSLPDGRGSEGPGGEGRGAEGRERGARLICLFGCGGDRDRTKRPKMAKVAETLADVVIVTSDNPRTEDPGAIIREVCAGFAEGWRGRERIIVEPDRRAAIQRAIGMANAEDVVLLAGKGHEDYQIIGTTKHHFDDVEEARRALESVLSLTAKEVT